MVSNLNETCWRVFTFLWSLDEEEDDSEDEEEESEDEFEDDDEKPDITVIENDHKNFETIM